MENQSLIHWEQRDKVGYIKAFWETFKLSMLEPSRFFDSVPPQGGFGSPIFYGLTCMILGVIFSTIYQFFFQGFGLLLQYVAQSPLKDVMMGTGFTMILGVSMIVMSPISCFINLFLYSGIYHLFLLMFGSGKNRFEATFRAYAYSQGPQLLQIIPFLGFFATLVWHYVILVIGFKKMHQATTAQALGAAILPMVLICGLTFFAIMAVIFLIVLLVGAAAHHS